MKFDNIIFIAIIGAIVFLSFKMEEWAEKFFEWSFENIPWLAIIILVSLGIFIAFLTIKNLKESYREKPEQTKKYILQNLKVLAISLGIALLIMGFVVYIVLSQY